MTVVGAGLAAATAALALTITSPIAQATTSAHPYCGITWGSLAKEDSGATSETVTNVRAGRHECFDRLVIDGAGWARVRYVDHVRADGSGDVVRLRGGARLEIVTAASSVDYEPTYTPANPRELVDVTGWRTLRQAASAGDFEGQRTLGLGVRARLPFRVFVLEAPGRSPRVVVDVAHRW